MTGNTIPTPHRSAAEPTSDGTIRAIASTRVGHGGWHYPGLARWPDRPAGPPIETVVV